MESGEVKFFFLLYVTYSSNVRLGCTRQFISCGNPKCCAEEGIKMKINDTFGHIKEKADIEDPYEKIIMNAI